MEEDIYQLDSFKALLALDLVRSVLVRKFCVMLFLME